ncbi:MAG TPA: amidohydrolase family protein, partial [Bacteroidia bacterium]|jgi:imidazolonepropionase-like amidohydrolase|nr:amidohydrolase family protein [Bacteroidia bacterium]
MKKILTLLFTVNLAVSSLFAQSTSPVQALSNEKENTFVFTHATIWQDPSTRLTDASMVVRKNKIVAVGAGVAIPPGAIIIDLKGKNVYPAFIDLYTGYGQPEVKKSGNDNRGPQFNTNTKGAYSWNQALKPEYNAAANFVIDDKKAGEYRRNGFGTVLSIQRDGIARGTAALVTLMDQTEGDAILKANAAATYSFKKGSSTQDYPSSLMGTIALLRQTYIDAEWYRTSTAKDFNISLESWNVNSKLPQIFEVDNYKSALRADKVGDEFNVKYIIKGGGDEYKRLDEIVKTGDAFIIPLTFPEAYDVSNPFDAMNISLAEMKNWELAPYNASMLSKAGVTFCITSAGLKEPKSFLKNLQKAVTCGLSKENALKALTTTPAQLMNVSDQTGKIMPGMLANFFVSTNDIFEKDAIITDTWIEGKQFDVNVQDSTDIRGKYTLVLDTLKGYSLQLGGKAINPECTLLKDTLKIKADFDKDVYQFTIKIEPLKGKGVYRLNGQYNSEARKLFGNAQTPDGSWVNWTADFKESWEEKKDTSKKNDVVTAPGKIWYPLNAYGFDTLPTAKNVLIKNATVWTNEDAGILSEADVLISNGKIIKVGKAINLTVFKIGDLQIIDGTGKHVTAGIIDEHSHIAINEGVNEGTQSVTSEVRIGDVLNPDDVNIYRQLAGGVTTSHLLHGSANAIGGQTALIKLRWGKSAEQLKFENADGFIKFALGENVKQSNWGDNNTTRYPQTRMGVEQVYMDAFTRAKNYDMARKNAASSKSSVMPRRDLELDALAEIINKKRFITCHSYEQSEINMLMHVADSFGFRVNTFTHILEGYKVADKMKAHGVGASTFSDWWAYKYEVMEAIPYNGKIMHDMGLVTAFNSDDAEMARRLNQEAAKAVKYGHVSEEEALKFVTLNPAKLLHIDNRVGSIKEGKDADIVIWNDNPLSVYAKPLKTFVDGICYFDIDRDKQIRERNKVERARLIKKMMDEKLSGGAVQKATLTIDELYHCNDNEKSPR